MTIRESGAKPNLGAGGGQAGGLPPMTEKGLGDAGLLQGGKNPKEAAQSLIQLLGRAGFQAPAGGRDVPLQLAAALKQFQEANKLPPTGQLDAATAEALKASGLLGGEPNKAAQTKATPAKAGDPAQAAAPKSAPQAPDARQKTAGSDGFDRNAGALLKQGDRQRADLAPGAAPDTNFLDALLNKLGPGGPNEGTSASDVKGAAQSAETASADQKARVAEAKKGEGVQKKGSTTGAQSEAEVASRQQLERGNASGVKVARGLRAEGASTDEQRRRDALDGHDPTELGILDEEADEDALEGAGDEGRQRRRGQGGEHQGASDDGTESTGSAGPAEDGRERDRGNASSGDDNNTDLSRGNASIDDGSGDGAGHYRVPGIRAQAMAAFEKLSMDAAVRNRATTYSWEVTFYRPGVYGPGQKAEELVHLVVDKATAFDAVWPQAQASIAELVQRFDPDEEAPSLGDFIQAMRMARSRDGDATAGDLKKLVRPLGRV